MSIKRWFLPDHPDLLACYRAAHVFVSMSEHEGFGVPLLEAMKFDVPVIAYDAAAVGETVDGAGVLDRHPLFLATVKPPGSSGWELPHWR